MQQQVIRFDEALDSVQPVGSETLKEKAQKASQVINQWLDSRSAFYSRLLGENISWRKALRVGVALPLCLVVLSVCTVEAPVVTVACLGSMGWIAYRLNAEETEKGGEQ